MLRKSSPPTQMRKMPRPPISFTIAWRTPCKRLGDLEAQRAATETGDGTGSLHAVRIAAKRVRYLIEVIRELNVTETDHILAQLRHLQECLGDWHDMEVMDQMMAAMLARPDFLRGNIKVAMGIAKLMLTTEKTKKTYSGKYIQTAMKANGWSALQDWVSKFPASSR